MKIKVEDGRLREVQEDDDKVIPQFDLDHLAGIQTGQAGISGASVIAPNPEVGIVDRPAKE